jgi:hypothetical protein
LYVAAEAVLKMAIAAMTRRVVFIAAAIAVGTGKSKARRGGTMPDVADPWRGLGLRVALVFVMLPCRRGLLYTIT